MHIVKSTPAQSAEPELPVKAANDESVRLITWPLPRQTAALSETRDPPDDYVLGGYAGI